MRPSWGECRCGCRGGCGGGDAGYMQGLMHAQWTIIVSRAEPGDSGGYSLLWISGDGQAPAG